MSSASDDIPSSATPPQNPAHSGSGPKGERKVPVSGPAILAPTVPGYELVEEIGRGEHSTVYRAIRQSTGQTVAIKILHSASVLEHDKVAAEVAILGTLSHPNIARIVEAGTIGTGQPFLVMDYVAGISFDETWKEPRASDPQRNFGELLRTFGKICEAIHTGHARGIAHRDLNPSNIRIDAAGEPHVLDFGLEVFVRELPEKQSFVEGHSRLAAMLSNEQKSDTSDPVRADIYSLGVLLYQSITHGRPPYSLPADLRESRQYHRRPAPPAPPSRVMRRGLKSRFARWVMPKSRRQSDALDAIVLKCLADNPDERYASAGELAQDMSRLLNGETTVAQGFRQDGPSLIVERRFRAPATAPDLKSIKAVYDGCSPIKLPNWDTLSLDQRTAIETAVVKAAMNLPRLPGQAVQALVLDNQTIVELQRISSLLNDILTAIRRPSAPPPPTIHHVNGGGDDNDDDELRRIWTELSPEQRAILKFIWKSGDNILTYTIIATQRILPRLSEDRKMRNMSRVTVRKHCRPMELPPLKILHRPGDRSAIQLTSRGRRLLELHVDSKNP